jgi:hypothetical protein
MNEKEWLVSVPDDSGHYIAGFTDGEGSFNVSLRKRNDHVLGWQIAPSFNVSQRDLPILEFLHSTFGCGTIRMRRDGVGYFEVRNLREIATRVIPFFERFQIRSESKQRNFLIFRRIIRILRQGPLSEDILREAVMLRETLNDCRGRKRKYAATDVLQ